MREGRAQLGRHGSGWGKSASSPGSRWGCRESRARNRNLGEPGILRCSGSSPCTGRAFHLGHSCPSEEANAGGSFHSGPRRRQKPGAQVFTQKKVAHEGPRVRDVKRFTGLLLQGMVRQADVKEDFLQEAVAAASQIPALVLMTLSTGLQSLVLPLGKGPPTSDGCWDDQMQHQ